jgi:hypothetical protein
MIRVHTLEAGHKIAEVLSETGKIETPEDILDIMADAGYNECTSIVIHEDNLNREFFDLKTKLAGDKRKQQMGHNQFCCFFG